MLSVGFLLLVTAHNLQSASVTKKNTEMDAINFPDDDGNWTRDDPRPAELQTSPLTNKFGESGVHESCNHLTYCTIKPPNYPDKKFNDMFKGYKIPPMPTFDALGNRQGDPSFNNDCDSEVTYEPLYHVRPKREDAWRTVVQAPDHDYIQRVRLETCTSTGSSCFKPFLPVSEYITSCEQVVNKWEVLVETLDKKGTEKIKAELPVCCSCKYKQMPFLTRFNLDAAKESDSKETKPKNKTV